MKVLLIDDDRSLTVLVGKAFESDWEEATLLSADSGRQSLHMIATEKPEIIIIDLGLPDMRGIDVLRIARSMTDAYIVILTAKDDLKSKIEGFEDGADDYIIKPFSIDELIARMKALLRRKEKIESKGAAIDDNSLMSNLLIDFENNRASINDRPVKIGPRQYKILEIFYKNQGQTVPREKILREVFPEKDGIDMNIVDVYVEKIKESLSGSSKGPEIITSSQEGYKFNGSFLLVS